MNIGIVLCTRINSSRVPKKCAIDINGKSILHHLVDRLSSTKLPVIISHPISEHKIYTNLINPMMPCLDGAKVYSHPVEFCDDDPLKRMLKSAEKYKLDAVIRVTHDKIFVDPDQIFKAIGEFRRLNLDYLYSSSFVAGTGFEIISMKALKEASYQYKKVEHISYAIKSVTENQYNWPSPQQVKADGVRLLIDFPEDVEMMTMLLSILGNECSQKDAINYLKCNEWLQNVNKLPMVTVYTCAYNAEKWIADCIKSVRHQKLSPYRDMEYIIVDDHSTDKTSEMACRFSAVHPYARYIRNRENIGLASSSNVALREARGAYIVRLDADDYFSHSYSVENLLDAIITRDLDAVYPNNYFGSRDIIQKGSEHHHIGGAIFKTRAINHVKFTEKLRNYEGLDFFGRAKSQLKIGYLNSPTFFYRQRLDSMSKTNLEERAILKSKLQKMYQLRGDDHGAQTGPA